MNADAQRKKLCRHAVAGSLTNNLQCEEAAETLLRFTTVNSRPQHFQSSSSKQGAGPLTITSLILRLIIPLPFQNWRRALSQINPALLLTRDSSRLYETGVAGSHLRFPFFLLIIPLFVLPIADVNTPSGRHQQRPFSEN